MEGSSGVPCSRGLQAPFSDAGPTCRRCIKSQIERGRERVEGEKQRHRGQGRGGEGRRGEEKEEKRREEKGGERRGRTDLG